MSLQNKTVIITGGTRGIGLAVAQKFLAAGANIAICGTSQANLEAAQKKLGPKVYAQLVDVSKEADCISFVENTVKTLGGLDILVNNAGIAKDTLVLRMKEADFDAVINTNLKGAFLMSKAAFKVMMKNPLGGAIVNLSSVVGQMGNAGQANYAASKAGIIGLTKAMAKEFASRNVRVNAVAPGFVETEMTNNLSEEVKTAALAQIPLKRFATAGDIADAVFFLSEEGAGYITGQVLAVNGGMYI